MIVVSVEINLIDPLVPVDIQPGACPIVKVVAINTHVFDANMQKKLLWSMASNKKSSHKNGLNSLSTRRH